MRTIENSKQLKAILLDICNWLKAKKHIDSFSFVDSMNSLCRIKIEFSVEKRNYYFYVTFWHTKIKSTKKFVRDKFASLNQSEIIFAKADRETFRKVFIDHVLQKRKGLVREIQFEEVLKILQKDGFISDYRRSDENEDKEGFDWFVYKNMQEIGIDVKSSIYGVKRAEETRTKDLILQAYDGRDAEISKELIPKINHFLVGARTIV